MYSKIHTYVPKGLNAYPSLVEASILPGLPSFSLSGLSAGRSHDIEARVRAAICNCGYTWPKGRIITSIAPAWLDKGGSLFDLPLALAIIQASGQISDFSAKNKFAVLGELGLNGQIRRIPRIISCLELASQSPLTLLLPEENSNDVTIFPDLKYQIVRDLSEVIDYLRGVREIKLPRQSHKPHQISAASIDPDVIQSIASFRGQAEARRGFILSLAGWHHLIALGAPGSGKTMLLSTAHEFLPPLEEKELFDLQKIYSHAENLSPEFLVKGKRPFVAPHSTVTRSALTGGGRPIKPGLFSFANKGVLFLDELTEYSSSKTEALREAMTQRKILLARADERVELETDFLLLAAANPCTCGLALEGDNTCRCNNNQVSRYLNKISGPLWDRFQVLLNFRREKEFNILKNKTDFAKAEQVFKQIKKQIAKAWDLQKTRFLYLNPKISESFYLNGKNPFFIADDQYGFSKQVLTEAGKLSEQANFSFRQYTQLLRLARTIADVDQREKVLADDLVEAYAYRVTPHELIGL